MPIRIEATEINKDINKFIKIFNYLKENNIQYTIWIEVKESEQLIHVI
jgi:hypothetical protein